MESQDLSDSVVEYWKQGKINISQATLVNGKRFLTKIYNKLELDNGQIQHITHICDAIKYEPDKVSNAFFEISKEIKENGVSNPHAQISSLKRILEEIGMKGHKLDSYRLKKKTCEDTDILPKNLRDLPDECQAYKFIKERLNLLKTNRRIRSNATIRTIVYFWSVILTKLFPDLETVNILDNIPSVNRTLQLIKSLGKNRNQNYVSGTYYLFSDTTDEWKLSRKDYVAKDPSVLSIPDINQFDGDHHRLSSSEQEKLWNACQSGLEKAILSLMLTTGLRIGGLAHIKLQDIITQDGDILDIGSTIEKGNKIRRFKIFRMTKSALKEWLVERRKTESPYLFPSNVNETSSCSTCFISTTFKKVAERAGLNGDHIHPHAIRHSVAYNLIEAGNSMDQVGKFLGHADPATTSKYYVKASTMENVSKMNTACIGGENTKDSYKPDIPNYKNKDDNNISSQRKKNKLKGLSNIQINVS